MKLSPAEYKLLDVMTRVVGNALPTEWLKPSQKRVAARMRTKGLLTKRYPYWAKATKLGLKAHRQHQ